MGKSGVGWTWAMVLLHGYGLCEQSWCSSLVGGMQCADLGCIFAWKDHWATNGGGEQKRKGKAKGATLESLNKKGAG